MPDCIGLASGAQGPGRQHPPRGIEPPIETLRALLRAALEVSPREKDRTKPIFVHGPVRSSDGSADLVVVGISEAGRAYGLAIGRGASLDETTARHAEPFARTAAGAYLPCGASLRASSTSRSSTAPSRPAAATRLRPATFAV